MRETVWHGSQKLVDLPDGSVRARYQVASTTDIKSWVLGWGAHCEVIRPSSFQAEIAAEGRAMAELYTGRVRTLGPLTRKAG